MAHKPRPVTAKSIQALLSHIGSIQTGTKDVVRARFFQDVRQPRLFDLRPKWKERLKSKDLTARKLRILSIDMGVKNLAYCHAEVSYENGDSMRPKMEIVKWEKRSILDGTFDHVPLSKRDDGSMGKVPGETDPYALDVLSATAYRFLTQTALKLAPDIILIEKQRWRSGSSAAILQWTVRVNTLETMLWAILGTFQQEAWQHNTRAKHGHIASNYAVHSVNPKLVGPYWLGQHAKAMAEMIEDGRSALGVKEVDLVDKGAGKISRSKAEKKAKIRLLRSWLSAAPMSTAASTPDSGSTISFKMSGSAETTRQALCSIGGKKAKKKKKQLEGNEDVNSSKPKGAEDVPEAVLDKLDDVTDCFLQAAAWVAWETNRLQLCNVWDQKRKAPEEIPPLDEEILRKMVDIVEKRMVPYEYQAWSFSRRMEDLAAAEMEEDALNEYYGHYPDIDN